MREQVLHYIRERKLLKPGDRVAVAVSGGADPVALLRVLLELRDELGLVLFVAHFNHQLRGEESDADERFVAELARRYDLQFFASRGDVSRQAEINRRSLEHEARIMRYNWLLDLAHEHKLNSIATAHNSDDQAETVLMKFIRGAGTRGLAGIHPVLLLDDIPVVRPMLETSRAKIERYLNSRQQPWREDHTNRERQHTRNRVRHELLRLLEREYNPNIRQLLGISAEVARAEEEFWNPIVTGERLHRYARPRVLRVKGFDQMPVAMQRRLLKEFLEREGQPAEFHLIEKLRRLALGENVSGTISGDWFARRQGDYLRLFPAVREPDSTPFYEHRLPIPCSLRITELGTTFRTTIVPAAQAALEVPGSLASQERVGGQLTLRSWLPGDRFRPAHTGSEEKLKRLFSEKKIPAEERPYWPVVINQENQIVWVRGFPVAHDLAWTPGSGDALRIEVMPYELPRGTSSWEAPSK